MSKFLLKFTTALALLGTAVHAEGFGLGRDALPAEIAAWDIDVLPGGAGLPEGSGDVTTGEEIFTKKCASCHGDFAEGVGNWPKLAGGWDTLSNKDPVKTVGSYWPYLSTAWDYINHSMPFGNAQTLKPDEVYALLAYILYSNDLVDGDFVLSNASFTEVEMPNADGFIKDNRAEAEYPQWTGTPCMTDCKENVEVTMHATVLDVTPNEDNTEEAAAAPAEEPAAEEQPAPDPELVARGEKVFRKCRACHQIGEGAKNRVGPVLTGVFGHPAGQVEGFRYSNALKDMAADGLVWNATNLKAFLADPRDFMKGTRMSFAGLRKDKELDAITAYLASFAK